MSTFQDKNKSSKLDGDFLKTMTNYRINAGHFNPQDGKKRWVCERNELWC